jgi:hypothetical protein
LPVTKRIDVMVGITRSKVIFFEGWFKVWNGFYLFNVGWMFI